MYIRFTRLVFTFFILFWFYCGQAQKQAVKQFSATQISVHPYARLNKFSGYTALQLPSSAMEAFCKSNTGKTNMRLSLTKDLSFDLELEHSTIVGPGYKLYIKTDTGVQTVRTHPDFLYKGKTKEGGGVRLAIKGGFISGSITKGDQEYFIEPMKRYDAQAGADEFIFYKAADVIAVPFDCGSVATDSNNNNQRTEGGTCKSAAVFNMVDYSIYQHYGKNIEAVENFLLTNLNNVEGVYTSFNFDPSSPSDTGTDNITFKVTGSYISTCPTCDFADSTNAAASTFIQLRDGFFKNLGLTFPFPFIPHLWTMRTLNTGRQTVSGVTSIGFTCMRHTSDDPLYLRLVTAHETGHYLGCGHDNDVKPDVKSFIMFSSASTSATRFSRLSDFGGLNYSSNLAIRQSVLKPLLFIGDCDMPACDKVKDITVQYPASKGPRISWTGNGRVAINYKLKNVAQFDPTIQKLIDSNATVLDGLVPCEDYTIEIKKVCSANVFGPPDLVYLNTGSVQLKSFTTGNRNGEQYDVSCKASGFASLLKNAVITVDHTPSGFVFDSASMTVSITNLFADGARHRIDITDHNNKRYCTDPFYFQAPYYRDNSTVALITDFNNCSYPDGWSDSLVQVKPDEAHGYGLLTGPVTPYNSLIPQGTIDSTCIAYFSLTAGANGKLFLQSPVIDLNRFLNNMLYFDYNFNVFNVGPTYNLGGSLSVEGFDGVVWKRIFNYRKIVNIRPLGRYNSVWDSIPGRKFITLDSFRNSNFRLRFIVDDAAVSDTNGLLGDTYLLAVLDNIRIDGFPKDAITGAIPVSVFPNPVKDNIFIKSSITPGNIITYRITDIVGRQIHAGKLTGNSINVQNLIHGIYIAQFFTNDKKLYSVKIVKQ